MAKRTFFDQWYRLANLRVGLRHSVSVRQTRYRDEVWYVYHEPVYNGFFRARPDTHALLAHITPERTLAEIWRKAVEETPEVAPGQEEFFELISSLYRSNLIYVEGAISEQRLLERSFSKKKKPVANRVSELFFLKIPLWDPDPFLSRNLKVVDAVFSPKVLWGVAALMLAALVVFALNADRAFAQGAGILQPHNLLTLFAATFVTHIFHEMAHAALCKKLGGDVRSMGVMLLLFAPLPFADVSSSWLMRNANHRAAIGAAGMFSDMIFCSLATLIWAYSPPGAINELALNVMFTTAVYTFVFNINPLMRFDGYYILSDVLRIPNLHQVSKAQFTSWWREWLLDEPVKPGDIVSPRRRLFLAVFFVTSFVYRNVISLGIILFLADQYFGLGLIGAAAMAYTSFIKPLAGGWREVSSPYFRARHKTLLGRGLFAGAVLIGFLAFVPMPDFRRVQGVIEAATRTPIHAEVDAKLISILASNGTAVAAGETLFVMESLDLDAQRLQTLAKIEAARARLSLANAEGGAALGAVQRELESLQVELADIDRRRAALVVTAPMAGIWVSAPQSSWTEGNIVARGMKLGEVLDETTLRFRGILPQAAAFGLGSVTADSASVRLVGDIAHRRDLTELSVIPYSSKDLPSQSLSPLGGGDVAVSQTDTQELQAVERYFLLNAMLAAHPDPQVSSRQALDGRSAWLRMRLQSRPMLAQWTDALAQFLQARYKL
jgi:putative peptide zinc metalloprotease protein